MKAKDLRERSVDDLKELEKSLRVDTFQNRLKNFTNRLDDTSVMNKTKRELARVITLISEKAAAEKGGVDAPRATAKPAKAARAAASAAAPAKPKAAPKAAAASVDTGDAKAKPASTQTTPKKKTAKKDEAK